MSARDLRVVAVDMPNVNGIATRPWREYLTTVDALEQATGYDFLDRLPDAIEAEVERGS
jgi:endonuclease G